MSDASGNGPGLHNTRVHGRLRSEILGQIIDQQPESLASYELVVLKSKPEWHAAAKQVMVHPVYGFFPFCSTLPGGNRPLQRVTFFTIGYCDLFDFGGIRIW